MLFTPMTSSASISSLMRIAPSCAVNPAPTCAASATPATSGVISRVFANEVMTPVNASAPICCSPLKPSRPTSVPVKNEIETTTKNMPPPTTSAPDPREMSDIRTRISLGYLRALGKARRIRT